MAIANSLVTQTRWLIRPRWLNLVSYRVMSCLGLTDGDLRACLLIPLTTDLSRGHHA